MASAPYAVEASWLALQRLLLQDYNPERPLCLAPAPHEERLVCTRERVAESPTHEPPHAAIAVASQIVASNPGWAAAKSIAFVAAVWVNGPPADVRKIRGGD